MMNIPISAVISQTISQVYKNICAVSSPSAHECSSYGFTLLEDLFLIY